MMVIDQDRCWGLIIDAFQPRVKPKPIAINNNCEIIAFCAEAVFEALCSCELRVAKGECPKEVYPCIGFLLDAVLQSQASSNAVAVCTGGPVSNMRCDALQASKRLFENMCFSEECQCLITESTNRSSWDCDGFGKSQLAGSINPKIAL